MSDVLRIETILGYVATDNHRRASRDGRAFEGILPAPTWSEEMVKRNGSVRDTVGEMKKIIRHYSWQTKSLSERLKGSNLNDTCRKIWNFLYTHIKYKEDDEGKEQLRTPARSWKERLSRGIDCDDFSIFCGSILFNLQIPFYIRIARYKGKDYFQHVYPVVPIEGKKYITIDAVLDEYDSEKEPIETKDFLVMDTSKLSGIDISVLGDVGDDDMQEITGLLSGADFSELEEMEGLGRLPSRKAILRALKNNLIRTRNVVSRFPHLIKTVEKPSEFLGMVDYALKYWDTDKRDEALGVLAGEEDRMNEMEGLGKENENYEDVELFYGLNGNGSYDVLGKPKRLKKFFSKVKSAAKKVGEGIKKVARALRKFNPAVAAIRAAVLLALRTNMFKVSSKLKWGYLTEGEAKARGFDMDEWRKVKGQLARAEKMFVDQMAGNAGNFKRAIINGRAGKLSGTDLGLGIVATAAVGASVAAASPFITKILGLLKKINFSKLISKVKGVASKIFHKKTEAEQNTEPTAEGETSIPTDQGETPPDASATSEEEQTEGENKESSTEGATSANPEGGTEKSSETSEDSGSASAENKTRSMVKTPDAGTEEVGFFQKAVNWVKENPTTSILIGGGAAFLLWEVFKPKTKPALSGARKGKKKKGKAKKLPPKTVSGTPKRRKRKGHAKKIKL